MKKIISVIFCLTLLFNTLPIKANSAEVKYSRILTDDVVLYMDSALSSPWFTLPYSYYVKILSVGAVSVKVEYKGDNNRPSVKGYIKTEDMNIEENIPSLAYPSVALTVNQTCLLYKDTDFIYTETVTQGSTVDFYGTLLLPSGEEYVYGYITTTSNDKYIGYISINALYDFALPTLKIDIPTIDESLTETTSETVLPVDNGLGDNLQIVIVIAISIVAISIVYLLFKPSKTQRKDEVIIGDDKY